MRSAIVVDSAASRSVNNWDQILWPHVHEHVRGPPGVGGET